MSYTIRMTRLASDNVQPLPETIKRAISRQLAVLGQHPTDLSEPAVIALAGMGQRFRFQVEHLADRWTFDVLFQYGQDEQSIHVLAILSSAQDRADADEEEGPAV